MKNKYFLPYLWIIYKTQYLNVQCVLLRNCAKECGWEDMSAQDLRKTSQDEWAGY